MRGHSDTNWLEEHQQWIIMASNTSRIIMASSNSLFPEGNFINRPSIFNGDGYHYWKTCMQIFIQAIHLDIQDVVKNGPFIPKNRIGDQIIDKPRDRWTDDDKKKVQHNLKPKELKNTLEYQIVKVQKKFETP